MLEKRFLKAGTGQSVWGCHFDPAAQLASPAIHDDQRNVSESYRHAIDQCFLKSLLRDFYTAHRIVLMYDAPTAGLTVEAQKTPNRQ
jgi:hypothetical protein